MILTKFCEKLKTVSSIFSMIENVAALLSFSSVPIKLIHCFKSGFSNSNRLLKPIAISLWWFKKYS